MEEPNTTSVSVVSNGEKKIKETASTKSSTGVTRAQSIARRFSHVRRKSFGFSEILGIKPSERASTTGVEYKRPVAIYLPTYQLDPVISFNKASVQNVIETTLNHRLQGHKYSEKDSPATVTRLAGEIMRRVKGLYFKRYRILVIISMGQRRLQSYNNAIAVLWDPNRDAYVDMQRDSLTYFIQIRQPILASNLGKRRLKIMVGELQALPAKGVQSIPTPLMPGILKPHGHHIQFFFEHTSYGVVFP